MGLLDMLQGDGGSNALLDFLRNNALNQNAPGGLPSDTANYGQVPQPAPMSFAPMQAPQQAPAPAAPSTIAAMPPKAAPMSMAGPPPAAAAPPALLPPALARQDSSPGIGDRLALGAKGFFGNMSSGPVGALIGGLGAAVSGQPTDEGSIAQGKTVANQRAMIAGLQARNVSNADITAALANPEYMKKVLDNSVKEKETIRPATAEERKAAFGSNDTGQPLFMNDETGKPTFGPAQTNVNVSTEKTGQAELAKTAVEEYKNAQMASRESQKRLALYDTFDKAAQGFTPGATAEMRLTAKRYLKDAGIIKGEDVPDGEVQQMIGRQLAIHAQPKGQGAVSNYERELYASALPSMTQSPEGLRTAIDINRKLEQFDMRVAQIWRESAAANRGIPNYLDVQNKIADLGSPLSPGDMAAIKPGTAPAASAPAAPAAPAAAPVPRPPGAYVWSPGKGLSK